MAASAAVLGRGPASQRQSKTTAALLCRTLLSISVLLIAFSLFASGLQAQPDSVIDVEFGLTGALARKQHDRFDRGAEQFRSSLQPNLLRSVEANTWSERNTPSGEFFLRIHGLFGEGQANAIGLAVGQYETTGVELREYRSDLAISEQRWRFTFPYLLFTYHYSEPFRLRPLRGWHWEAGGGFGLVFNALWEAEGFTAGVNGYSNLGSRQRARNGSIARLELAMRRSLGGTLNLRLGPRIVYAYSGGFRSTAGETFGARWFYLRDGSLYLASAPAALAAPRLVFDENLGLTQALLAEREAELPFGALEWQISISARF